MASGVCLNINISMVSSGIKASVSEYCSVKSKFIPLFVDEGVLLVDYNGGIAKLLVNRR